jgi:hypothetical protein
MMLNPRFHGTKWRKFRMNCFLLTGFFACAPIVHGTIRWGMEFVRGTGVAYYLAEVLLILIGCYFYEVHNMIILRVSSLSRFGRLTTLRSTFFSADFRNVTTPAALTFGGSRIRSGICSWSPLFACISSDC